MEKNWEKSKIDIYFDDYENDAIVRQGFNNLTNEVTEVDVQAFVEAVGRLHKLDTAHAIVTDSHLYLV